ncbi:MAG: UDP-N-acetylmuramate--L-alanine ligase [Legionellales bacterium]|nr:UDP-N-acetylmuramate--L-alanine ligase [Legionellales bacterium]
MYASMAQRVDKIHFVGIGGVGMCGIAEVLLNQGYQISGSDLRESVATGRLQQLGATIAIGHEAKHIAHCDVVVKSTAVTEDNPEIVAAKQARIPVVPRAGMLAGLMRFKDGIAIAGTHGKTTTTSLISSILAEGELDPTYVIGGKLNSTDCNAYLGQSRYFVAEADESDASFLYLTPNMLVVTNIDDDHLATYQHDFAKLQQTFVQFIQRLPFYGLAVLCLDDPVVKQILPQITRPVITYGFDEQADVRVMDWQACGQQSQFSLVRAQQQAPLDITLNLSGQHNVLNAVAAITIATQLGVDDAAIQRALNKFAGIGRRFQVTDDVLLGDKRVTLVDDYAHHPREIAATLQAARQAWPDRRLKVVFQPHRYSRTQQLFDAFIDVLNQVDHVLLLDIFPANETPIIGVTSEALANAMMLRTQQPVQVLIDATQLCQTLADNVQTDDVVLMLGAGSIGRMAAQLTQSLHAVKD